MSTETWVALATWLAALVALLSTALTLWLQWWHAPRARWDVEGFVSWQGPDAYNRDVNELLIDHGPHGDERRRWVRVRCRSNLGSGRLGSIGANDRHAPAGRLLHIAHADSSGLLGLGDDRASVSVCADSMGDKQPSFPPTPDL